MYSFSEDAVITGAISRVRPVASDVAGGHPGTRASRRLGSRATSWQEAWPRRKRKRGGVAEPRSQGESGDPFGRNEPTGHSEPRGPLICPLRDTLQHIAPGPGPVPGRT